VIGRVFVAMTVAMLCLWGVFAAERFIDAKIANDSSIARDTRRIADALEATNHKENN
jgi:hypothetical protein